MREATLRLALDEPAVRSLINPRQSAPVAYADSPLNAPQQGDWANAQAASGQPAPEALLHGAHGAFHLTQCLGTAFTCLVFSDGALPQAIADLADDGIAVLDIAPQGRRARPGRARYGLPHAASTGPGAGAPRRLRDGPLARPGPGAGAGLPAREGIAAMTDIDLDRTYTALCRALAEVGPGRSELLLAMVALALMAQAQDAKTVERLVTRARDRCLDG
jgi:hypothetical protein